MENTKALNTSRGGRGAAILQLLKNSTPGGVNENPSDTCSSNNGNHSDTAQTGSSGSTVSKPPFVGRGRGHFISNLLQNTGRDMPTVARGRGFIFPKVLSVSPKQPLAEQTTKLDTTKVPPPSSKSSSGVSSEAELSRSLEKLDVERKITEYHGTTGKEIPINVNTVKVHCKNEAVYQYCVSFNPEVDSKNMRFILLNQHKHVIGHTKAFDGRILYLPKQLQHPQTLVKSNRFTDGTIVEILIRLTQVIHPASPLLIPFYNTVLHRCMQALKMCPVGRNYYDPNSPKHIDKYKISLWPGYVTAIKSFEGGLLMNIDVSHKVLRSETARSLMQDIHQRSPSKFQEICMKELIGSVVLTRYNNKNYRIDDISWTLTPTSSFTNSKGESITFQDYYRIQYKIEIQDLLQPMLIHRPKRKTQRIQREKDGKEVEICLVPELCYLTGITDKQRSDFRVMKDIKEHTCMAPTDRIHSVEQFLERVNSSPEAKAELMRWGLQLDRVTSTTTGRQFPPEKVMVGRKSVFTIDPNADFSREIARSPVITPVHLNNWLLCFTRRDSEKARNFYKKMMEVTQRMGVKLNPPNFIGLNDDRSTTYKDAIAASINAQVQLVVCIFPTSRDDRYSALKKLCCVDIPVPSQVIISRTLPSDPTIGKFRSVTMKIALQINCKLGGELWRVDIPLKGLMVCGIDVYHEPGGRGKSVAAFVASSNDSMTRWYSRAVLQGPNQEIMDSLKRCFTESIKKYHQVNHALPLRIVIYRDGVGDGQLKVVSEHEMPQLESCFRMFDDLCGQPYKPKLSVVIVSKRINIRIFATSEKQMLSNPPPGTVLDHFATRPNWPDFFLVSQHVRQGTVSPTHYIVVSGDEHLPPDHMQRLSYKLTHMYYNWAGTVRVPAPCQYAHKLAYLVGQSVRAEPSIHLADKLYYL